MDLHDLGATDERARSRQALRWHPLALVPLALTAWVYHPIVGVFFYADDMYHLGRITNVDSLAFVLAPFGGHNLLVRNLAFLGSWHLFGLHSEAWYATVLLTHLLNVWLLFAILGSLTGSARLACFGATQWGISPLAAGTIGWYSVYGQTLVATVLLLILDALTRLSATSERLSPGTAWGWYALLLAGTTCFGTGIGVALVFPVVLFLLLPSTWRQPGVRLAYLAMPAVTLAVYFGLRWLAGRIEPLPFGEAIHKPGLSSALSMLLPLLGVGIGGGVEGHFFTPARFPEARTFVTLAAFVAGLGIVAWRGDARTRRAAVAMTALAVGTYGVVALGRAPVYTSFHVPLTGAAAAPRYHYVGTVPIVILLCLTLGQVGRLVRLAALPRDLLLAAGLGISIVSYARSSFQIDQHAATRAHVTRTIHEIMDAIAVSPPGSVLRLENERTSPVLGGWLDVFFPGRAALFLLSPAAEQLDGRDVRFVEPDPRIIEFWAARPDTRLAKLLVAPVPAIEGGPGGPLERSPEDGSGRQGAPPGP